MKKGIIFIIYVALIAFTALLSELNNTAVQQEWVNTLNLTSSLNFLLDYKVPLIILSTILLVLLPNPQTIVGAEKYNREIRQTILEQIRDEVFNGTIEDKRITILCKSGRLLAFWLHIKRLYRWCLMKIKFDKFSNLLLHRGTFLVVKHRISNEDDSYNSKAAFFCHHVDYNKCEGVAAVITRSNRTKDVSNLPNLENIDLKNAYLENDHPSKQALNTYMERTHIRNLRTLLKIRRKGRHFFGMAICGKKGTPVGALLVDSMEEEFNLNEEQKRKLQSYSTLLGKTFN